MFGSLQWALTEQQRQALVSNAFVKKQARSERLAALIRKIDDAEDRVGELQKLRRENADFRAFVDQMLIEVQLGERDAAGNVQFTG